MKDRRIDRLIYVCIAVIVVLIIINYTKDRRKSPVILVGSTAVTYTYGESESVLLSGVTAYDKEDGDITDGVRVEDAVVIDGGRKLKVFYVVSDSDNNITRTYKVIKYQSEAEEDDE